MSATGEVQFDEPGIVTEYVAKWKGESIIIAIIDHGPRFHVHQCRYFVRVRAVDDPRRKAAGNGGTTPIEALEAVHWDELEKSRYPSI